MAKDAASRMERNWKRTHVVLAVYVGILIAAAVIFDFKDAIPLALHVDNRLVGKVGGVVLIVGNVGLWVSMMALEWRIRHRLARARAARRIGWGNQILMVVMASALTAALHVHSASVPLTIVVFNVFAAGGWAYWIRLNALTPQQQADYDQMVESYEAMAGPAVHEARLRRRYEAAIAPYRPPAATVRRPHAPTIRTIEWNIPSGRHEPKVYFIVNGTRIKIGTTVDIRKRVRALSLRMDNVALLVDGGQDMERFYHDKFKAFRIGDTEWFTNHAELVQWIAGRQNGGL